MIPFSIQREALPTQTQVRKPTRALTAEGRTGRAEPLPRQLPNEPPRSPPPSRPPPNHPPPRGLTRLLGILDLHGAAAAARFACRPGRAGRGTGAGSPAPRLMGRAAAAAAPRGRASVS